MSWHAGSVVHRKPLLTKSKRVASRQLLVNGSCKRQSQVVGYSRSQSLKPDLQAALAGISLTQLKHVAARALTLQQPQKQSSHQSSETTLRETCSRSTRPSRLPDALIAWLAACARGLTIAMQLLELTNTATSPWRSCATRQPIRTQLVELGWCCHFDF